MGNELKIKVKYHSDKLTELKKINIGDWVDLRAAEDIYLRAGEFAVISLGVSMKLPDGYEAHIAPRSSTFKNYGLLQTNSVGVVDNSYSGNEDIWKLPVYATRDTKVQFDDRICQFRIMKRQPEVIFEEVDILDDVSRGGFGSTGTN